MVSNKKSARRDYSPSSAYKPLRSKLIPGPLPRTDDRTCSQQGIPNLGVRRAAAGRTGFPADLGSKPVELLRPGPQQLPPGPAVAAGNTAD